MARMLKDLWKKYIQRTNNTEDEDDEVQESNWDTWDDCQTFGMLVDEVSPKDILGL